MEKNKTIISKRNFMKIFYIERDEDNTGWLIRTPFGYCYAQVDDDTKNPRKHAIFICKLLNEERIKRIIKRSAIS
jgi:hypothetical protein